MGKMIFQLTDPLIIGLEVDCTMYMPKDPRKHIQVTIGINMPAIVLSFQPSKIKATKKMKIGRKNHRALAIALSFIDLSSLLPYPKSLFVSPSRSQRSPLHASPIPVRPKR